MKSGSCQEHGIAITILSCSQPHHLKKVTWILLLMTAGHIYCSGYGSCKKVIKERNFFTENRFIIPTSKTLLVLRVGSVRRHKLCKGNRLSLKNSYPHLSFLFSPLRDHFQGINNLVIHESEEQIQPLHSVPVSFRHQEQMNICQHVRQRL